MYKVHTCLDYCIDLFAKLISKLSITIKAVVINFNANKPIIIDSTITVVYLIEVGKQGCTVGDDRWLMIDSKKKHLCKKRVHVLRHTF